VGGAISAANAAPRCRSIKNIKSRPRYETQRGLEFVSLLRLAVQAA
jgi:hypothetical protein